MKKLIISVVLSTPLFFTTSPGFAAPTSTLYNPESRTAGAYSEIYNNNLPKTGTNYAYRYGWHHWHGNRYWHRDRWHRGHWHRGHRWHRW